MVIMKARNNFLNLAKLNKVFFLKCFLILYLVTTSTSSPQVNQEIYSEEDLLAIDSSPHEVIHQLAMETFSVAQGTILLPPPSFQPSGKGNHKFLLGNIGLNENPTGF
jgi:hypothetical protein